VRLVAHCIAGIALLVLIALFVAPAARILAWRRRRSGELPRIIWAPTPIINIRNTAIGDRMHGYESTTLVYDVYRINAQEDFDIVVDLIEKPAPVRLILPYLILAWSLLRFDLFGLFFDGGLLAQTPLWRLELPLIKLAGKRIVVYPYGSDARIASETRRFGKWNAYTDVQAGHEDRNEQNVRARVAAFGHWADQILGCGDLVEHLPRVDGMYMYAIEQEEWPATEEVEDGVVTVVHSSNHRHFKGTRFLIAAMETLRSEGAPVELVLVEGVPNAVARETYARADIIVENLLIGSYALFAIEGMALGKPVVCYLNDRFRRWHPEWVECPIVNADPDQLVDELRALAGDPARRRELGRRGVAYVRRHHDVAAVGARMDLYYRRAWFGASADHGLDVVG
jgi:hypothetical protein